ncbi:MAG: hypothetical protein ACW99V_04715, partial [Candidatus Thorarchaeota archaeon]
VLRRAYTLTILGTLQHETKCRPIGGVVLADSVSRKKRRSFDLIETWGRIMTLCFEQSRVSPKKSYS